MCLNPNRGRRYTRAVPTSGLGRRGRRLAARPAEVLSLLHDRDKVRRNLVALVVALVDRRPQQPGSWLDRQTDRVAQAPGKPLIGTSIRRDAENGGASLVALIADVARRADRDVHGAVRTERHCAREVTTARQIANNDF